MADLHPPQPAAYVSQLRSLHGMAGQALDILQNAASEPLLDMAQKNARTEPVDAVHLLQRILRAMVASAENLEEAIGPVTTRLTTQDGTIIVTPVNALGLDPEEAGS